MNGIGLDGMTENPIEDKHIDAMLDKLDKGIDLVAKWADDFYGYLRNNMDKTMTEEQVMRIVKRFAHGVMKIQLATMKWEQMREYLPKPGKG